VRRGPTLAGPLMAARAAEALTSVSSSEQTFMSSVRARAAPACRACRAAETIKKSADNLFYLKVSFTSTFNSKLNKSPLQHRPPCGRRRQRADTLPGAVCRLAGEGFAMHYYIVSLHYVQRQVSDREVGHLCLSLEYSLIARSHSSTLSLAIRSWSQDSSSAAIII
jgi:hypothetical protein